MARAKRWMGASVLSILLLTPGVRPSQAASLDDATSAAKRVTALPPSLLSDRDHSYAEREKRDSAIAHFRGGDSFGIYIGGSAAGLIIVLLIVLIVLR